MAKAPTRLEGKFAPTPSLLRRVGEHWRSNLPKAYAALKPETLPKAVQQAQDQIALLVEQGYDLPGATEIVYPSLFPEPEDDVPKDQDGAYI